jgi:hypothetical protein
LAIAAAVGPWAHSPIPNGITLPGNEFDVIAGTSENRRMG